MSLTQQALWILERNLTKSLSLQDVAGSCNVTHFHLAHAFARRTGQPLVGYLRARRLTLAARSLAGRHADILDLALESGYASHEAFTRAFKTQFGATPRSVRNAGSTDHLNLVEPLNLPDKGTSADLAAARARTDGFAAIGMWGRIEVGDASAAARLWHSFMAQAHCLVAVGSEPPIGISRTTPDPGVVDYACAVVVQETIRVPKGLSRIRVPGRDHAVFTHPGHISTIGATYATIWDAWSAPEGWRTEENGLCLERHRDTFDPTSGFGGVDIWVPIQVIAT
jgi:AraC family transcriptional regulator